MHDGLVGLGIGLLFIGAVAFLYFDVALLGTFPIYPYRSIGLVLLFGGIICIALGAVYYPRKETRIQTGTIPLAEPN